MSKKIPLTQGKFAIVDDKDYKKVSQYKWQYCLVGKNRDRGCVMWRGWQKERKRKQTIIMSRLIMDAPKGRVVDHKNGNTLDNRRGNLRICTNQQNLFNQKLRRLKYRSSQYKGVSYFKRVKKWTAQICFNCKSIHLGYFDIEKEAAIAYNKAAAKYFGEFARLNNV